jgi:hypothetical protein
MRVRRVEPTERDFEQGVFQALGSAATRVRRDVSVLVRGRGAASKASIRNLRDNLGNVREQVNKTCALTPQDPRATVVSLVEARKTCGQSDFCKVIDALIEFYGATGGCSTEAVRNFDQKMAALQEDIYRFDQVVSEDKTSAHLESLGQKLKTNIAGAISTVDEVYNHVDIASLVRASNNLRAASQSAASHMDALRISSTLHRSSTRVLMGRSVESVDAMISQKKHIMSEREQSQQVDDAARRARVQKAVTAVTIEKK